MTSVPYDTMSTTSREGPTYTKCCCCIPLRIGCFILGYLNVLFNSFHTLSLVFITTTVGISTHGFTHFDYDETPVNEDQIRVDAVDEPVLNQIGLLLMVVLCLNIVWLAINIACLVGLHKKRPGPIRVYVGFATGRLLLSLAGFVHLVMTASAPTQTIVTYSFELGLTAYYVLVYYIYAVQLERELLENQPKPEVTEKDIAFIYPTKLDKEHLVV